MRVVKTLAVVCVACMAGTTVLYNCGWSIACEASSARGQMVIIHVHKPWLPFAPSHYYYEMRPPRLVVSASEFGTLKSGGSAFKPGARVGSSSSGLTYLGYLGALDDDEAAPSRIEWSGTSFAVFSEAGLVGLFDVQ